MRSLGQKPTAGELEDIVSELDTDNNGTIDFDGELPLHSPSPSPSMSQDYYFPLSCSQPHLNPITEFLAMMTRVTKEEDTDEELRRAFQVFDRDNSGTISTDELRDVLKSVGENLSETELDEMMRQVDVDGSGTIDCEFFHLFLSLFFFLFFFGRGVGGVVGR